jgi:hypothetical protein
MADTKTTVDVDVDLLRALLDRLTERRSESEVVEDALRRYLAILDEFSSSEELLEALEDLQDLRDYDRAVAADDGARVPWEDLAAPNTR